MSSTKRCVKCKIEKPPSDFYKDKSKKDGLTPQCKNCRNEYLKKYRLGPGKKKYDDYIKKYRQTKKHKDTQRSRLLKINYGLNVEDWEQLFEQQHGRCAICGIHQSKLKRALDTDHNHISEKCRGLLCTECNTGLGKFKVDTFGPLNLQKAIEYLMKE